MIGVHVIVGPDQDQGASTNRDRIRCYECWEYDHFAKDCPTSRGGKGIRANPTDA